MILNIKKMKDNAKLPTQATSQAAGIDLYACVPAPITIEAGTTKLIGTGVGVEIPEGYAGFIFARSGTAYKRGLAPANKVGVIDSDYRGELIVALHNHSDTEQFVDVGERIAQLVLLEVPQVRIYEVDNLSTTKRGTGGFGSTGRK